MCLQVMHAWQQEAAVQINHRALLGKYTRQMQHSIQARVLRTWCATAQQSTETAARAQECHARLTSRRLKCALCFWCDQAMAKRKVKEIMKVCTTVCMAVICGVNE